MSQNDALAFINAAGQPGPLHDRVSALRGRGVLDQLCKMGEEMGLKFTPDEYRDAVITLADGELSDEALDEVLRETGLKPQNPA